MSFSAVLQRVRKIGKSEDLPPPKTPYRIKKFPSMHLPGMLGFHDFATGVHETQKSRPLIPRARFIDTITNQTKRLVQPSVSRNSVIAKAVFVHEIAAMVNVARVFETRKNLSMFKVGRRSHECLP